MSINDLTEQFEIQGKVVVKEVLDDFETKEVFSGEDCLYECPQKYKDAEIVYMYPRRSEIVIEVMRK